MGNYTVLVGKNNEGKSNLIRALNLAIENMKQIASHNIKPSKNGWNMTRGMTSNTVYSHDIDFPKITKVEGIQQQQFSCILNYQIQIFHISIRI